MPRQALADEVGSLAGGLAPEDSGLPLVEIERALAAEDVDAIVRIASERMLPGQVEGPAEEEGGEAGGAASPTREGEGEKRKPLIQVVGESEAESSSSDSSDTDSSDSDSSDDSASSEEGGGPGEEEAKGGEEEATPAGDGEGVGGGEGQTVQQQEGGSVG